MLLRVVLQGRCPEFEVSESLRGITDQAGRRVHPALGTGAGCGDSLSTDTSATCPQFGETPLKISAASVKDLLRQLGATE